MMVVINKNVLFMVVILFVLVINLINVVLIILFVVGIKWVIIKFWIIFLVFVKRVKEERIDSKIVNMGIIDSKVI